MGELTTGTVCPLAMTASVAASLLVGSDITVATVSVLDLETAVDRTSRVVAIVVDSTLTQALTLVTVRLVTFVERGGTVIGGTDMVGERHCIHTPF